MKINRKLLIVLLFLPITLMAQIKTADIELVVDGDQRARPWLQRSGSILFYGLDAEYTAGNEFYFSRQNGDYPWVCLIVADRQHLENMTVVYNGPAIARIPQYQNLVLDNTRGRDYLCLLYSTSPIEADHIASQFYQAGGNFYQRVEYAIRRERVELESVRYVQNQIGFSSVAEGIVPLYVEIEHK